METRTFGRTGWSAPVLGLGTYCITTDRGVAHDEAVAIVRRAVALGIGVIDTAPLYGSGEAEVVLREALAGARAPYRLLDKVGRFEQSIFRHRVDEAYRDPALVRAQFEHSLRLLGRDSIDMLLIHEADWAQWWTDRHSGDGPVVEALDRLRREGRVERIGISARDLEACADLCATGRFDALLYVHYFNVVWQEAGDDVVGYTSENDMGLAVGAPFRRGLLVHGDEAALQDIERTRPPDVPPGMVERIRRARAIAHDAGMMLAELGLRYLISLPGVHVVLVGPETVEQLEENVRWAERGPLDDDTMAALRGLRDIPPGDWGA